MVLEIMPGRAIKVRKEVFNHKVFMVARPLALLIIEAFHSIRDILIYSKYLCHIWEGACWTLQVGV